MSHICLVVFRFMPHGSYLNAYVLGPKKLAKTMNDIIKNNDRYYDFFRWHRYYSLHEPVENADTDQVCNFCAYLNDESNRQETNVYENIIEFWSCTS